MSSDTGPSLIIRGKSGTYLGIQTKKFTNLLVLTIEELHPLISHRAVIMYMMHLFSLHVQQLLTRGATML